MKNLDHTPAYVGLSLSDFIAEVMKFQTRMGIARYTQEQRQQGMKSLTLTYLNLLVTDEELQRAADLFSMTQREYCRRMELMGMEPLSA